MLAGAGDLPGAELMLNFPDYEADKGAVQRSAGWPDYHHHHLDTVTSFHIMHIADKVSNFWIFRYPIQEHLIKADAMYKSA